MGVACSLGVVMCGLLGVDASEDCLGEFFPAILLDLRRCDFANVLFCVR